MLHIYNLRAIKSLMKNVPKAQRLQNFFNKGKKDNLTEVQIKEVIHIIESESKNSIDYLKENL